MNSKKLNARDISELLNIQEPPEIAGGTIPKDWILSVVSSIPSCKDVNLDLPKQELLKAAVESVGGIWNHECVSDGSTITAAALSRLALGLEPRLEEMREIWKLLGRDGYPSVNQKKFVSTLYSHYFDRVMESDVITAVKEILNYIDVNHGLDEDEITIDGEPTSSVYQVILNNLSEEPEEEEDSEFLTQMIRTNVTAESIDTLVNLYKRGRLNLNPPWQRGEVWSPKKKKAVIESIMLGIPLPAIILHKNSDTGRHEVIDGQQRLRSIVHFVENKFPLAKFNSRHDLSDISQCYFGPPKRKAIDDYWRDRFALEKIPVLTFEDVPDGTLRKVFNLYNTASMKLNAAEIRNATYQNHPIHRLAFILAGENPESEIWYVDEQQQRDFTSDWRDTGSTTRFAATELICQYFAYSRPERSPNSSVFKGTSTANSINRFLDNNRPSSEEEIKSLAQEVIDSYYFAEENFDLEDGENYPFSRNDKNGVPQPNKLATITNMVASRMLMKLIANNLTSESEVINAIETILPSVNWPENQNAATIWGYQADVINGLLGHLGIQSDNDVLRQVLPKLVPCMDEIRNPLPQ